MINLTFKQLTPSSNYIGHAYHVEINPSLVKLDELGAQGWEVESVVPVGTDFYVIFQRHADAESFSLVGQATGNATTTEFLIVKSWTFGEIAQTAFLFLIAAVLIFQLLWTIFRKKNTYDL